MRVIANYAATIFERILQIGEGKEHFKIDNTEGSFMPVVVEYLGEVIIPGHQPYKHYSIAHYYEQNGDLMADPEMCLLKTSTGYYFAYYFKQDGLPIEIVAMDLQNGNYKQKYLIDNAKFFNQWMKNIKAQQGI